MRLPIPVVLLLFMIGLSETMPAQRCGLGRVCPHPRSDSTAIKEAAAFDRIVASMGLEPLRRLRLSPEEWEMRWWTRGFADVMIGISMMIHLSGNARSLTAESIAYWAIDAGKTLDSMGWHDDKGRGWRNHTIAAYDCARVERRPPFELCYRSPLSPETSRTVRNVFEAFGGWDLPDQSAAEERDGVLDGGGFLVELLRGAAYRNYGYDNSNYGSGLWARADSLRVAISCAAGWRVQKCLQRH